LAIYDAAFPNRGDIYSLFFRFHARKDYVAPYYHNRGDCTADQYTEVAWYERLAGGAPDRAILDHDNARIW
jgi:hypothetical protein